MGNVWLKPFLLLMFDSMSLIFIKETKTSQGAGTNPPNKRGTSKVM
jgi:hypothetical protein